MHAVTQKSKVVASSETIKYSEVNYGTHGNILGKSETIAGENKNSNILRHSKWRKIGKAWLTG